MWTHLFISRAGKEFGYFGFAPTPRNYSAVAAAAILTTFSMLDQLGRFDAQFASDFNDVDFWLKARAANYRIAWTPYAHFTHHERASITRKSADPREQELFTQPCSAATPDPYFSVASTWGLTGIYGAL